MNLLNINAGGYMITSRKNLVKKPFGYCLNQVSECVCVFGGYLPRVN